MRTRLPGYVCPNTKRVAMSLRQFYDMGADVTGYWLNEEAASMGLDGWAVVDGLDPHVDGKAYDVWFANGSMITLPANDPRVIFVSAKQAALDDEAETVARFYKALQA